MAVMEAAVAPPSREEAAVVEPEAAVVVDSTDVPTAVTDVVSVDVTSIEEVPQQSEEMII